MSGVKMGGGATHFAGNKVGTHDEHVHGKEGGGKHRHEGATMRDEKPKESKLREKFCAHIS